MNRCTRCSGEMPALAVFCPHCAQPHEPDFDQLIGQTIDARYRIYRRLGSGGLSTVFAATDLRDDCVIALKISDPTQLVKREMSYAMESSDARGYWAEMLDRMRHEAETLADIRHPNIVRYFGAGKINDDLGYAAMEYLRGHTLREEMDERGRFDPPEAARIASEIASALAEVHARGIVHRDINPRNIFLAEDDPRGSAIKLIDFGIAKFPQPEGAPPFTRHAPLSGTVAYASPEQCQGRALDHRSDIYSLAVVLYEMLTGQRPFQGRTPTEIALKQIQTEPVPPQMIAPDISTSLEETILRALRKNPDERHQDVAEFAAELRARSNPIIIPLTNETLAETPQDSDTLDGPSETPVRRGRAAAVIAIAALALILAGVWLSQQPFGSRQAESVSIASSSPSPSLSPTPASDADAMELAARRSDASLSSVATPPTPAPTPVPTRQAPGALTTTPTAASRPVVPATPKPEPQAPPMPAPQVAAERQPQPESRPRIIQQPPQSEAPSTARADAGVSRNEPATRQEIPAPQQNRTVSPPPVTRDEAAPAPNARDDDREQEQNDGRLGPRLIQWSGPVSGQRQLTIEMPGGPGRLEIPRAFRARVGLIEPPSAANRWQFAVLRVYGKGNVSFVLRWWPEAGGGRFSEVR